MLNLRIARVARGLTLFDVQNLTKNLEEKVAASTLSLAETGKLQLNDAQKTALATVFPDLKPAWLFAFLDTGAPETKACKTILTPLKLSPALQARINSDVAAEMKKYDERKTAKEAALVERGKKMGAKINNGGY